MIPVALGFLLSTLVHLTPETPVGTRATGAAASIQIAPAVAWNGHTGLAVWTDQRGTYPADNFQPRIEATPTLRVSPMRADGSLVNPEGTPLFPARNAKIASNGTSFMLAYANETGAYTVPLDENGTPDGVTTRMGENGSPFSLVANHSTFLFASPTGLGSILVTILQPSGVPFARTSFDSSQNYGLSAPAVTTFGDVYALAYDKTTCFACAAEIHVALLADDAATTDALVYQRNEISEEIALAANDDRLLVAIRTLAGVQTFTVGRDLHMLAPLTTIAAVGNFRSFQPAFWDGQSFLVTWNDSDRESADPFWRGVRVSPANVALDTTPIVIARTAPDRTWLAGTSDRIVAMWASYTDVFRRTFISNADLSTQPETKTPEVFSLHAQSSASLTSFGGEPVRVWREGSLDSQVKMSIGDKTIDVASSADRNLRNPSVATGAGMIFVLWRDLPQPYYELSVMGQRIYARRFSFDGTPLDVQPILLDNEDDEFVDVELSTASAFDGRNFVAIWSGSPTSDHTLHHTVRAKRVSPGGTRVDDAPFVIPGITDLGFATSLRAVATGNDLLVAWSSWNDYRYIRGPSPLPPPSTAIEIVRLDTRGTTMNVSASRELWIGADLAKYVGLAWNGTNALLADVRNGCVEVTLLDAALGTVRNNTKVECGPLWWNKPIEHPAVAWNGSEFVVAWAADAVHAMRFDRALQPLDDAPFSVAPADALSHEPALAASSAGVDITYERFDGDVPRLFARELDRLGVLPRTRSIR